MFEKFSKNFKENTISEGLEKKWSICKKEGNIQIIGISKERDNKNSQT